VRCEEGTRCADPRGKGGARRLVHGYGNLIIVTTATDISPDGAPGALARAKGDEVRRGDAVGTVGDSGSAQGHLSVFELRRPDAAGPGAVAGAPAQGPAGSVAESPGQRASYSRSLAVGRYAVAGGSSMQRMPPPPPDEMPRRAAAAGSVRDPLRVRDAGRALRGPGGAGGERSGRPYRKLDVFSHVLSLIQNNYVEDVDDASCSTARSTAWCARSIRTPPSWSPRRTRPQAGDGRRVRRRRVGDGRARRRAGGGVAGRRLPRLPRRSFPGDKLLEIDGAQTRGWKDTDAVKALMGAPAPSA